MSPTRRGRSTFSQIAGWVTRMAVGLVASGATSVVSLALLFATVVVAVVVTNATLGLTLVVAVLTLLLVMIEPRRRLEQRDLFWRYVADAVYEAVQPPAHCQG